jgi:putative peptide zinc metalloprotease protein
MNLAEALNAALPELPVRGTRVVLPRLDPNLVVRENIDDGKPVMVAIIRGRDSFFRFSPDQWRIIELFDGMRSWEDVAQLHSQLHGVLYSADDLREFTGGLDEAGFWYKTPLERNIALQQKLEAGRHQHSHRKSKWGDIAHMQFSAWDPDRYFDRIHPWLRWIYTKEFAVFSAAVFTFMAWVYIANWSQIGKDSLLFYNFTEKTAGDLAEFWILFLILAFFHESAHGLTCKHYGGQVHAMGFHLIYLTPAFFVDVSEAFVYASRWQRLIIILAGIGIEMVFCAVATVVWWGTPPGSPAHDLAYKIMLITGVAVVVVNMNPLIKLDGYYAFSEIIGFADIKEKSTAYLSGLVRRHLFRLPGEIEFVPRRRRLGFIAYAVLSGVYSYGLLFAVLRFSFNVFSRYIPQWAFVPAVLLGLFMFRSRIRTLTRFFGTVYLDKREHIHSWFTPRRAAVAVVLLLAVLFAPLWPETVAARFLLEPGRLAVVRTRVPGRVESVLVKQGQFVHVGDRLFTLSSPDIESARDDSDAQVRLAGGAAAGEQLSHGNLAGAIEQHRLALANASVVRDQSAALTARAPIDGVVTAAHPADRLGSYLDAGETLTGIADTRTMKALIYVPEYIIGRVRNGARVSLLADGALRPRIASVDAVEAAPHDVPPGVEDIKQIRGDARLTDYLVEVQLVNDGGLFYGMTGSAKIFIRHTSLAAIAARAVRDFFDRKVW